VIFQSAAPKRARFREKLGLEKIEIAALALFNFQGRPKLLSHVKTDRGSAPRKGPEPFFFAGILLSGELFLVF
jgi:hypothetical protein